MFISCLLSNHCSPMLSTGWVLVQFSQPQVTTGKTLALTIWTFVDREMSLLFNTLSRCCHSVPAKKQLSSDFMAAITIHSDFRAQEEEICHYFHLYVLYISPIYFTTIKRRQFHIHHPAESLRVHGVDGHDYSLQRGP